MQKIYKCKFCERPFASKQALWSHTGKCKQNPNATNREPSEKQRQTWSNKKGNFFIKKETCFCKFCNREFNYKYALTLHMNACKKSPNYSEEAHLKRSERCKKAVTQKMRQTASENTVFNNFWEYRAKNPIIYTSPVRVQVF